MSHSGEKLPPMEGGRRNAQLTNNDLASALKLSRLGSVQMIGLNDIIRPPPGDAQLRAHLTKGMHCEVLGDYLWSVTEAIKPIIAEDTLNSGVEMSTNNNGNIGIHAGAVGRCKPVGGAAKYRWHDLCAKAKSRFRVQALKDADLLHLQSFAVRVPRGLNDNLWELDLAHIPASCLRCKPIEFGLIAKVDTSKAYS